MSLFNRESKVNLLSRTRFVIGRFDPEIVDYDNVRSFKFKVKEGRSLHVRIASELPVDVAVFNSDGQVIASQTQVSDGEIDPVTFDRSEGIMLVLGVYRGDMGEVETGAGQSGQPSLKSRKERCAAWLSL